MWLVFSLLSLLCYAMTDMLGKKYSDLGHPSSPAELLTATGGTAFLIGTGLYLFGVGESGLPPWELLKNHPLILLSVACYSLHWLFFLLGLRYIGLSAEEAVQSSYGVFYFVGLVFINLITDRLSAVGDMLHPFRLIPIAAVIVFTVLLPNTEVLAARKTQKGLKKAKAERRKYLLGILLLLLSTVSDSLDSLLVTYILEEDGIGNTDYMTASYFAQILPCLVFFAWLSVKKKKLFHPFRRDGKWVAAYVLAGLFSSVLYLVACSFDAVRTGILFLAYPIVPILGAKILLKEKYTVGQNLCIWMITLFAILFCIADGLL